MRFASLLLLTSLGFSAAVQAQPDSLEQLADDFWTWRAKHAPFTADDVNRIERPAECAIGLGRVLTGEEKIWPDLKHAGRN